MKKRELKAEEKQKTKKGVKFNDNVQTHVIGERRWNDYVNNTFQKGAFSEEEVKKLLNALCSYAKDQDDPLETLTLMCQKSKSDLPAELFGAWPKIAECLPQRSVQSCHNLCRRRFNPENYGGKWAPEEESQLLALVDKHGKTWKDIANQLNEMGGDTKKRTAMNVKDKYKQLGADNALQRNTGPWSLKEAVRLLENVCYATQTKSILRESIELVFKEKSKKSSKRLKIDEEAGKITIYQPDKVNL